MRLFIVTTIICIHFSVWAHGQQITLQKSNISLGELIREIKRQSGYNVLYDAGALLDMPRINVNVHGASVNEVLERSLNGLPLSYIVKENNIIISKKPVGPLRSSTQPAAIQPAEISGRVLDTNGKPLAGVSVVLKGTNISTLTATDGTFMLQAIDSEGVLVFSYVGMKSKEVGTSGNRRLTVEMEDEVTDLDEVVAIGYGTVRKSDLTGAVGSVKGTDLSAFSNTTISQALQGRVAGVQVQQNNGHPGANMQVRIRGANSIRGNNEPLWIIDGFPGDPNMLNTADIASMEILKDASATAIYGSRGGNGVILITTKQGKKGVSQVNYSGSFSNQVIAKELDLMNATEYMQLMNIIHKNKTGNEYFTAQEVAAAGAGTDWQDVMFRNAPMHDHSLNISGGNEKTQFAVGTTYFNQQGIIKNSGYSRLSLRGNISHDISDKLNVSSNLILSRAGHNKQTSEGGNRGVTLIGAIIVAPPTLTPYNEDGSYRSLNSVYPFSPSSLQNPVAWVNERSYEWGSDRTMANLAFTYKPITGLAIKVAANRSSANTRQDNYTTTKYPLSSGTAGIDLGETVAWVSNNIVTYDKVINNDHSISLMGGLTYEESISKGVNVSGQGFLSDLTETYNIGSAAIPGIPSSSYSKWSLLSYLSRVNYSYKGKYLATASFRADGSSRYSRGSKWGYFPSGALAWRVSEEGFMRDVSFISDLKLRASYGETGSTAISPYSTLDMMSTGQVALNNGTYTYFSPSSNYLSALRWETTSQIDFGIDASFLNNRLRLTADYYIKKTRDLLNVVQLPRSSGYTSSLRNVGNMENRGLEFQVDANLLNGPFSWNIATNVSFNRNKVAKLAGGLDVFGNVLNIVILQDQLNLLREGEPMGVFYGYQQNGFNEAGNFIYKDNNEDGVISAADKTIIGDPNPDFIYGLNSTMKYKGFTLGVYIQGTQGNDIYSLSMAALAYDYVEGINTISDVLHNHWTADNPNAKYPSLTNAGTASLKMSDHFVYDGSYLRLKNIELAYDIPARTGWSIKNAQIYFSAQNWFTLTSYPFWDPDVNAKGGGNSVTQGVDEFVYPTSKSTTIGVRLNF